MVEKCRALLFHKDLLSDYANNSKGQAKGKPLGFPPTAGALDYHFAIIQETLVCCQLINK